MAFQKKCLDKMRDAAKKEGRTVLYVSHNMNTIRQLCDRCIVLDKGRIVFKGDVEAAIGRYMDSQMNKDIFRHFVDYKRPSWLQNPKIKLLEAEYVGKENIRFEGDEPIRIRMKWRNLQDVVNVGRRVELWNLEDVAQATYILYDFYSGKKDDFGELELELDSSMVMDAEYKTYYTFFQKSVQGNNSDLDCVPGLCFQKTTMASEHAWIWRPKNWGYIQLPSPRVIIQG